MGVNLSAHRSRTSFRPSATRDCRPPARSNEAPAQVRLVGCSWDEESLSFLDWIAAFCNPQALAWQPAEARRGILYHDHKAGAVGACPFEQACNRPGIVFDASGAG